MDALSRRLAALERKRPPPGPPSIREQYADLPPGSEAIIARAVLDAACALEIATGGAPPSRIGPAIVRHEARVVEAIRAGRPAPGPLSECGEIIDPAAVAELLDAAGLRPGSEAGRPGGAGMARSAADGDEWGDPGP